MKKEDHLKIIFGLKVKQIRTQQDLSLFKLSKLTGLSKSYLNEIEKGKKYPKEDKIELLATALKTTSAMLISKKLDQNLSPIGQILESNILKEIPLELFGIEERDLIDIIAEAPIKVTAFLSTLIEIGNHYNLTRENFFLAALRSYQEANRNYFEEIEKKVELFNLRYRTKNDVTPSLFFLESILEEEYGYSIKKLDFSSHGEELENLRSIYLEKNKTLLINECAQDIHLEFIYAKEIGYHFLESPERLYTFPWAKHNSFDPLLHNFYHSYFAGALLIPKMAVLQKLEEFFMEPKWNPILFNSLMTQFTQSPETFYQRISNLLSVHFKVNDLFFIRMSYVLNTQEYHITKELHLSQNTSPHANETLEHYCRRWLSITLFNRFKELDNQPYLTDCQISQYPLGDKYLIFTTVTKDHSSENMLRSVSIGLLIGEKSKKLIHFLEDPNITQRQVGVTCESCSVENCGERVSPPLKLQKEQREKTKEASIEKLKLSFG
ncbi:MAG: DNA-binding protein [Flavobacteriaceae bacterium]|nr:MAG: DNA-binding protein [Flavobacteriaceae bacterium]